MASSWLLLMIALCGFYFIINAETIKSDWNSDLAKEQPSLVEPSLETGDDFPEDLPATPKTNLSTTDNTTTRVATKGTVITTTPTTGKPSNTTALTTKRTGNATIQTTPTTDNNTRTPSTEKTNSTTAPTTKEAAISTSTNTSTTGSLPSTGTSPPTMKETTTISTSTSSPMTETTPTNNVPSNNNYLPNPISVPTGWLYPGFFWPSSYSSLDYIDQQISDETGEVIIEDFKETIVIQKRTIRKKENKYMEEGTGISQVKNNYGSY